MTTRAFFFFNDTATTEIYTLSLHDALPICENVPVRGHLSVGVPARSGCGLGMRIGVYPGTFDPITDRKSTRLNSSHSQISYAVFCLKKKKNKTRQATRPHTTLLYRSNLIWS